jgi:protein-S-isoprenylcysteine O-methyltransferase Ste14
MDENPTANSAGRENPLSQRPGLTIQIGKYKVTRWAARIVLLTVLGLLIWLTVWMRPRVGMLLTAGVWFAFEIYWGLAARNSARAKSSEPQKSRALHVAMLYLSLLLLFIPVPGLRGSFLPAWSVNVFGGVSVWMAIGLALQVAFFALAAWARRHLGRNWSGEVRIGEGHQLVRSGPYRCLRHPIYTAVFGMSIGTAIVGGQIHALVGLAILTVAYARKIPMEEKALREAFGAEYEAYRRKSWALFPPLW